MTRAAAHRLFVVAILAAVSAIAWSHLSPGSMAMDPVPQICGGEGGISEVLTEFRLAAEPPAVWLAPWMLMVAAMASPLLAGRLIQLTQLTGRLFWVAAFLIAFAAVWAAAGEIIFQLMVSLHIAAHILHAPPALVSVALALLWQATPWKQRSLNLCHLAPPPEGTMLAALRFGGLIGLGCFGVCGPGMLAAMMLSPGSQHSWIASMIAFMPLKVTVIRSGPIGCRPRPLR